MVGLAGLARLSVGVIFDSDSFWSSEGAKVCAPFLVVGLEGLEEVVGLSVSVIFDSDGFWSSEGACVCVRARVCVVLRGAWVLNV